MHVCFMTKEYIMAEIKVMIATTFNVDIFSSISKNSIVYKTPITQQLQRNT